MNLQLEIFKRLKNGDNNAFEHLFKEYYSLLCSFSNGIVKDKHISEDIVENFFFDLWINRAKIEITASVRSYFIHSVYNRSINYVTRVQRRYKANQNISNMIDNELSVGTPLIIQPPSLLVKELENEIKKAIDKLPENCRNVFQLSRNYEYSYEEISQKMGISINTVKTQIKIALNKLREDLKDYLTVLFFVILMFIL